MEDAPLPNEYSITLKSDKNNKFNFKFIGIDNYLLIQSKQESKDNNNIYENKIQLSDIKLNKYFSICDSIFDVLLSLKPNLSNNIKLEEIKEELNLTIPLNHPLAKEISFNLKKINKNKDSNSNELIQTLYNLIYSLSEKVENQQKEIESLKKRVNDLENLNQNITTKKSEENNIQNKIYFISKSEFSYIIRNKAEEFSIRNWINGNKQVKLKLIFRMSIDGNTSINFHSKCDNKGKTLILIETKDGKRIGGYTSLQWNMDGQKKYGDNLWLFTMGNNMFRFPLIQQNKRGAIICDMDNGPSFEDGIIFKDNTLSVGYIENKGIYNNGKFTEEKFYVKELEVFQIYIKY